MVSEVSEGPEGPKEPEVPKEPEGPKEPEVPKKPEVDETYWWCRRSCERALAG